MLKHVFIIEEQLCQSFWQVGKAFRFEAKKSRARAVRPPPLLEASRVNELFLPYFNEKLIFCFIFVMYVKRFHLTQMKAEVIDRNVFTCLKC